MADSETGKPEERSAEERERLIELGRQSLTRTPGMPSIAAEVAQATGRATPNTDALMPTSLTPTFYRVEDIPEEAGGGKKLVASRVADQEVRSVEGAPLISPTIMADLKEQGLQSMIPALRMELQKNLVRTRGQNEVTKLQALIDRLEKDKAFEQKVRSSFEATKAQEGEANLSDAAQRRVGTALDVLDLAREKGLIGEGGSKGALSEAIKAALVSEVKVGPEGKSRIYLTQLPGGNKPVMDIPETHARLRQRYYSEYLNKNVEPGQETTKEMEKAAQKYAAKHAAKDIIGISARFQGIPFLDPRSPETVKELIEGPYTALRAHLRTRTTTDIFAPTLEEVKKAGGVWEVFRKISPLEYVAPQAKLFRERIEEEIPELAPFLVLPGAGPFSPVNASLLVAGIFGQSERVLASMGYTPEDMVNEYLDGHLWLDESSENYALVTKASFLLRGFSEEEAELERQRAKKSKINKFFAFTTYFGDPDLITVGLTAAGPVARKVTASHFNNRLDRALDVAEQAANAETAAQAIRLIKEYDEGFGILAEAHIDAATGKTIAELGDTAASLGQAEAAVKTAEKNLADAAMDIDDDVSAFIRRFIVENGSPEVTPEFLEQIRFIRANSSTREVKELLTGLEQVFESSLSAASASLVRSEKATKVANKAELKVRELATAITVRKRAEARLEEIADEVLFNLSPALVGESGAKAATAAKQWWFLERRIKQLELGLSNAQRMIKMSKISPKLREQVLLQHLSTAVVREIREAVDAGKSLKEAAKQVGVSESIARTMVETGSWATASLGNIRGASTVDSLTDKEIWAIAKRLNLTAENTKEGRELLRKLIRKHARTLTETDLNRLISNLNTTLARLRKERPKARKAVKTTGGNLPYLEGLRKAFNERAKDYLRAVEKAKPGSEGLLVGYRRQAKNARELAGRTATRAERGVEEAVRAFSTHNVFSAKKIKTRRVTGKVKKKAVSMVGTAIRAGKGPGPFKLSDEQATAIVGKFDKITKAERNLERVKENLETAQRDASWRQTLKDAIADIRKAKDNLTERQIWDAVVHRISKTPLEDIEPLQKVINRYTQISEDGTEATLQYQRDGKSIIKAFQEAGVSPKRLQDSLDRSGEIGLQLQKVINSHSAVPISIELNERLKDLPAIIQATHVAEKGAETQALLVIRTQANIPKNSSNVVRTWLRKLFSGTAGIIRWLGKPSEGAMVQRLGITTEKETQALRASEQMINQIAYEMQTLIRLHKIGDDADKFLRIMGNYLDSTTPMPLHRQAGRVTSYTVMNASSKSLFQNMKAHVINWHASFTKQELKEASKEAAKHSGNMNGAPDAFSPAVSAFSRIWIGSTVPSATQAAHLYREAVKILQDPKFSSFQQAVLEMKKRTRRPVIRNKKGDIVGGGLGKEASLDSRLNRVYGFAATATMNGAMLEKLTPTFRGLTGGVLTTKQVEATNALMGAVGAKLSEIENIDEAVNTLWQIGGALSRDRVLQTGLMGDADRYKTLVKIARDPQGNDVFVTGALRAELLSSLDGKIKELHLKSSQNPDDFTQAKEWLLRKFLPFWKQSATMGAYIPNAGYTTYVRVGDLSQLFLTSGPSFALRSQLLNVWSDIPFFGTAFQNHLASQVSKTGKPAMRSVFETTFSPQLSDFFSGKDGFFRLPNGEVMSLSGLREKAVREGMVDVFPHAELEEGLRVEGKAQFDALLKGRSVSSAIMDNEWNRMIKDHATQTQLRQRVGTWLLHMKDGKSPEEAAKLVRESLYDWTHGVGKIEQRFMASWMPFWRYWRLATAQTYQAFLQPFMDPSTGKWLGNAMLGDTRINRLRILGRTQTDSERVLADPRSVEDVVREDGYAAALARAFTPPWMDRQVMLYNRSNELEMQRKLAKLQRPGKQLIQTAGVLPPIHGIDHLEMMLMPFIGMSAAALYAVGEDTAAHHLGEVFKTGIYDKLSPWYRDMFEESYAKSGQDLHYIRPVQAAMLEMVPVVEVEFDPETGRKYTSFFNKKVIEYMPVIGTEIPRFLDAAHFKNPHNRDEWQKGLSRFFLEYTRMVREYSYDPYVQIDLRMQKALTKYQEDTKRAGYLIEKPD